MQDPTIARFHAARMWLTVRIPFLGHLMLRLTPRVATPHDSVRTMAVTPDGIVYIDPTFAEGLSDGAFRAVVCHELLHVALGFWMRCGTRAMHLFNLAHDLVINDMLDTWGERFGDAFRLPECAVRASCIGGRSAEEVYELLRGELRDLRGAGSDGLDGDCRGDLSLTSDGQAAARGDAGAVRRLQRAWENAIETAWEIQGRASGHGNMPLGLQLLVEGNRVAAVPWAQVLAAWLGERTRNREPTWMRPSRRSESADVMLPGMVRVGWPTVTILWDTSGSMDGEQEAIFAEVRAIVDDLGLAVRFIACDADVQADVEGLDAARDLLPHLCGGGGSSFVPAFERLAADGVEGVLVAFTDGYIDVPDAPPGSLAGVVWVLTARGVPPAPWGEVLRLETPADGASFRRGVSP